KNNNFESETEQKTEKQDFEEDCIFRIKKDELDKEANYFYQYLFKNTKTTETKKYSEVNNLDIIKSYRDERVKEIRRQISDFYSHYKQLENKYVVALTQYNEWQKLSDKKISEMICKKINA